MVAPAIEVRTNRRKDGQMSVREKWIGLLHRAATGTRRTRSLLTPVGILVFGVFTALFVVAAVLFDGLLRLPKPLPDDATLPVGVPMIVLGCLVTGWSAFHFLKVKGTPVPFNPPAHVVTTGPYRYARNPMLTGVFLVLFGIGFSINSLSSVLVFTPLYIAFNIWELRSIEEPELVRRLGEEYVEYRERTPMFIPALK
jgi:protein-S-isoprenylcysteine O-methyltransferase Ste14